MRSLARNVRTYFLGNTNAQSHLCDVSSAGSCVTAVANARPVAIMIETKKDGGQKDVNCLAISNNA